jgi:hypothetical protein
MSTVFTCDHRYGDAVLIQNIVKIIEDYINDPINFNSDQFKDFISFEEK